MRNLKGKFILILLAFSWLAMFWLTGSRQPWQDVFADNADGHVAFLGTVQSVNYDRMGFTRAIVKHTVKGNGWLVGTDRGELFLFASDGSERWKRSLGIGKLVAMGLSDADGIAYVGEQSQTGNLYAINIENGDIIWKRPAADYVGTDVANKSLPSVVHLAVDGKGNVFANCYRFFMQKNGSRNYCARLVGFSKEGQLLWQYPRQEVMDSWINWCDVNDANGRVVFSTSAYERREQMKYRDTMYFIDKFSGELLHSVNIQPVEPFQTTVMRGSPNFSKDGRYLAGECSDGRAFLFDGDGKRIWERHISIPAQVGGSWINASGRDAFAIAEGIVFTTISTFNRENWQLPTPVEHPCSNSLFVFNYDGTYKFQYRAEGTMEEIAFSRGLVACAIGRNVRTHNYAAHGALVIDLRTGAKRQFFHTEGPMQAIAINNDGTEIAGVEAPAVTPDNKNLGAYRLHIWSLKDGEEG